jgi:hypothetical protein
MEKEQSIAGSSCGISQSNNGEIMYKNIVKTALKGNQDEVMNNYRFRTVWWTPAAIERIWETLADYTMMQSSPKELP